MNLIVKMYHGSTLFGTRTPESDVDYKGVSFPLVRDIILNKLPRFTEKHSTGNQYSRNTSKDKDIEILSLYTFIEESLAGQSGAFDMLHTPKDKIIQGSLLWNTIVTNREKFYSKQVVSFVGFAQSQASKYSVKGDRLNTIVEVIEWFKKQIEEHKATKDNKIKIKECDLSTFPTGEWIQFIPADQIPKNHPDQPTFDTYEICGCQFQVTVQLTFALEILENKLQRYGDRAKKAAKMEGADWKAISHAFRAAYQAKELFTNYTITFPRPESKFLTDIKLGVYKYTDLETQLEELILETRETMDKSDIPEHPDYKFWEEFTYDVILNHIKSEICLDCSNLPSMV